MPYSSAETMLGKFFDIASYLVVMAFIWAVGIALVASIVILLVCSIIQLSGGHHFLMDLP